MTDVPAFRPREEAPAYVRRGETVLWRGKPTLAVLASQVFFLGLAGLFAFTFLGRRAPAGDALGAAYGALVLIVVGVVLSLNALRLKRTEYVITGQGLYTRTGIIGQTVVQTTYEKITDIAMRQDVLGRILGYATLHVNTAGSNQAPVRMEGLRQALAIKEQIEAAREGRLRRADRAPEPLRSAQPFVPSRLLVQVRCPTRRKTFRRPRAELGQKAPCPHCGKQHVVKEARAPRATD